MQNLSFLYPAGLLALLTLVIPFIIHLFNKSRGRLVKIGSIDLLRLVRQSRVTEVKLAQYLLLFLRLLILTLATLILAQLARQGFATSRNNTAYVTPGWLQSASGPAIDELLSLTNENELFVLETGFRSLDSSLARSIADRTDVPRKPDIWPLLAERLGSIRHLGDVSVYTNARAIEFGNEVPYLPKAVKWHLAAAAAALEVMEYLPKSALIVYDTDFASEADLLSYALNSLQQHRLTKLQYRSLEWQQWTDRDVKADWLILLTNRGWKQTGLKFQPNTDPFRNQTVLIMSTGTGDSDSKLVRASLPEFPFSGFTSNTGEEADSHGAVLWRSDGGIPLLHEGYSGPVRILSFSGLNSSGQLSLLRQPEFPEILLQLMLTSEQKSLNWSAVTLPTDQLTLSAPDSNTVVRLPHTRLQPWLVALLIMLWLTERIYSERRTSRAPPPGGNR